MGDRQKTTGHLTWLPPVEQVTRTLATAPAHSTTWPESGEGGNAKLQGVTFGLVNSSGREEVKTINEYPVSSVARSGFRGDSPCFVSLLLRERLFPEMLLASENSSGCHSMKCWPGLSRRKQAESTLCSQSGAEKGTWVIPFLPPFSPSELLHPSFSAPACPPQYAVLSLSAVTGEGLTSSQQESQPRRWALPVGMASSGRAALHQLLPLLPIELPGQTQGPA